jgi:hypothetical protein
MYKLASLTGYALFMAGSATFRSLYHPKTDEKLDEALALYFPQPNRYTTGCVSTWRKQV